MKRILQKALLGLVVLIATTALNSCKKEVAKDDYTEAYDHAFADETFNDAQNMADEAATTGGVSYKTDDNSALLAGCATVTRDTISVPRVTTIDFGSGCTGPDGRTRSGQIIVTHTGPYRNPGTTITITFNNYFVNQRQILGTKTIHNDGPNANGNLSYTVSVSGQIVDQQNGHTITWSANRVREWISGENTPECSDDVYSITGTANGSDSNGGQFSATITTALIRNLAPGCRRHFTQGILVMQRSGKPQREVNFGNGACDNQATVTVNGHSHTIQLR